MVYDGTKTVAAAGTRETLTAARTTACWVIVQALSTNTGSLYVGGSTVSSTRGAELLAGDSVTYPPVADLNFYNLALIYIDVATSGEGARFIYARR